MEFHPPADRIALIDQAWQAEQADARQRGFEMFNGKLARLVSAVADGPGLAITLQPTDFRSFLVTNLLLAQRFAPAERANAMGVSSIICCADARLVLGRRSQRVAYHRGKLHTIGGVLDWIRPGQPGQPGGGGRPDGPPVDGGWLFDQLLKELNEELGLGPEELTSVTALALARDTRIEQPELLCLTEIGIAGDELFDRWRQTGEFEHADLWGCHDSPEAVAEGLIRHAGEFTPIAVAALLAYLSVRHGVAGLEAMVGGT
jgi:hypothetical protein